MVRLVSTQRIYANMECIQTVYTSSSSLQTSTAAASQPVTYTNMSSADIVEMEPTWPVEKIKVWTKDRRRNPHAPNYILKAMFALYNEASKTTASEPTIIPGFQYKNAPWPSTIDNTPHGLFVAGLQLTTVLDEYLDAVYQSIDKLESSGKEDEFQLGRLHELVIDLEDFAAAFEEFVDDFPYFNEDKDDMMPYFEDLVEMLEDIFVIG